MKFCSHCESYWQVGITSRLKPSIECLFADNEDEADEADDTVTHGCPFCGSGYYCVNDVEVTQCNVSVKNYTGALPVLQ